MMTTTNESYDELCVWRWLMITNLRRRMMTLTKMIATTNCDDDDFGGDGYSEERELARIIIKWGKLVNTDK